MDMTRWRIGVTPLDVARPDHLPHFRFRLAIRPDQSRQGVIGIGVPPSRRAALDLMIGESGVDLLVELLERSSRREPSGATPPFQIARTRSPARNSPTVGMYGQSIRAVAVVNERERRLPALSIRSTRAWCKHDLHLTDEEVR